MITFNMALDLIYWSTYMSIVLSSLVLGWSHDTPANNLDFPRANLTVKDQIIQKYEMQRSNFEIFIVSVIISVASV